MTKARYTRHHRRPASREMTTLQSGQREPLFFGETASAPFFHPAIAVRHAGIQRKCAACEGEEKVQRVPEKKKEERVQRAADKKEEEKLPKPDFELAKQYPI